MGNPAGEHCLACEYVGTQLAQWFGLPTFQFAIIQVTDVDELPFHQGGNAQPGPAFITRMERGQPWGGSTDELRNLANRADITRLVIFDTWTRNPDRYSVDATGRLRINYDNVFLSSEGAPRGQVTLKAMDHTHCFTNGGQLTHRTSNIGNCHDPRVYGLFSEFRPLLDSDVAREAVQRLRGFRRADAQPLADSIPNEWDVGPLARQALAELLVQRAQYLAENLIAMLWPSRELDFTIEGEDER